MARQNLEPSLRLLFGDEGGYSNRVTDSGGPTKFGITHRTLAAYRGVPSVTAQQVKDMTIQEAEEIYRRSYWLQSGGDLLPSGLDYAVFNSGVMSGPSRAVKILQSVVGVTQDGVVGVQTVAAVKSYRGGIEQLIRDYCDAYMRFLRGIGGKQGFSANGRGWTIRITGVDPKGQWKTTPGVVGNAIAMSRRGAVTPTNVSDPAGAPKANPKDTSIVETLKKPEAWGPLGGLIGGVTGIASGTGPIQWAFAIIMVAGVLYGLYTLIQRQKAAA